MAAYEFNTKGTCARTIRFGIDENSNLYNVQFYGGCPGNLLALSTLLEGADAHKMADKLRGIPCGNKPTSCSDQLAKAIDLALKRESEKKAAMQEAPQP